MEREQEPDRTDRREGNECGVMGAPGALRSRRKHGERGWVVFRCQSANSDTTDTGRWAYREPSDNLTPT